MSLFRSLLIGVAAGTRSLTPLAALANVARSHQLRRNTGALEFISSRTFSNVVAVLAAAELLGDKMPFAPDRTVTPATVARIFSGSLAAMSVAPRNARHVAALVGAGAAVGSAYLTLRMRKKAIQRWGRVSTGLIEDILTIAVSAAVVRRHT